MGRAIFNLKMASHNQSNGFHHFNTSPKVSEMPYAKAKECADYLLERTKYQPKVGIICGSGLGPVLSKLVKNAEEYRFSDIPHFPECTAPDHESVLLIGLIDGIEVMLMKGRFHLYEGYSASLCSLPVRVMKLMGVEMLLASNAAGGISFKAGTIMLLKDHIYFPGMSGASPLAGPNEEKFGSRFIEISDCYDPDLRRMAKKTAADLDVDLKEGTYAMFGGPNFETPTEIQFLKNACGANAVGMSTAYEAITARHCGMRVMAFSFISNMASFEVDEVKKTQEEISSLHSEVVKAVAAGEKDLNRWVPCVIKGMMASS